MRRAGASLAVVALAAVLALAAAARPCAAAPAASLRQAADALASSRAYDAQSAQRLADEVEPALQDSGDEDALALVQRLREARSGSERAQARDDLAAHVRTLVALERGAAPVRDDPARIKRILAEEGIEQGGAAQEFLQRLQKRLLSWLERVMSRVFGSKAASTGFEAAYYVALAVSALVAAWLVWRVLSSLRGGGRGRRRRRDAASALAGEPVVDAARDLPNDALAFADAEAASGRFREAVRALFGGAARALVEHGAIPAAKTRTTAEILRDVAEHAPAAHRPLAALAAAFEPAWYGHQDPGRDGYERARQAFLEMQAAAAGGGASR
ncbi:DUF4129 domain-containing protein [Coriobacteriia bacterium Es71-Z0120]|uniref:DUF4129 domain-containing protein n=1 Tax=Parvivirga hydrogeniphila TaxID=2939460 RepID=UPI0022610489|nr:DUF4129 domain-containing protein [Parvivirga hydrogeniphila]MCL4079397.1 DUF4129 domain-containing protein [Parvivirga hydrogeniphila]